MKNKKIDNFKLLVYAILLFINGYNSYEYALYFNKYFNSFISKIFGMLTGLFVFLVVISIAELFTIIKNRIFKKFIRL